MPREVERAVRDVLREIQKVKAEARKRLDAALVLENQLYQRETVIAKVLSDIALGKERFQESLMVAERAPLWQLTSEWQVMGLAAGEIAALLSRQLVDALEFLRTHLLGIFLVVSFLFLILIVAALLSRKVAQWTQDHPNFEEATHFLKRPVSLALLITLVLSLVFFHANAPRLIRSLEALLLLIPVLRLLPRLIHPAARPVLFTVAVFYIFDSARDLLLAVPLVDRLAFLLFNIIAIIVLIWLLTLARVRQSSTENGHAGLSNFPFPGNPVACLYLRRRKHPGIFRARQIVEHRHSLQRLRGIRNLWRDQSASYPICGLSRHGPGPVPRSGQTLRRQHFSLGFSYSYFCRGCAVHWSDAPILYGEGQRRQRGHGFSDGADPGRTSGFLALGHHRFRFSSNRGDPDLAGSSASPGGRCLSEDAARQGYPRDDYDHGLLRDPAVRVFLCA